MDNHKLYFKNLDSIRFFAAMIVFLGHTLKPSFDFLSIQNTFLEKLLKTITNGGLGVSVFFVLSGFLITYLLISEYEVNGKISLRNFYIRRVLRIWPLYFLLIAITFMVYPLFKSMLGLNHPLHSNILYHLSFLSNFDVIHVIKHHLGNDAMSQNITWSVSIEEQFYLFWPLIFVFMPKKTWIFGILTVIAGSLIFRIINRTDDTILYFHTFSVLLDLGIGGLMACIIKNSLKIRTFFENTSTYFHLTLFAISFCLILWESSIFSFQYGNAISRLVISVSFAFIIVAQAITKKNSILNLGRFSFANKWGKYTYGIYLIHPFVITFLSAFIRILHISKDNFTASVLFGIVCFVVTLALSKLSFDYYESRFLKLKDRFTARYTTD